ncbi:hypothetical protein NG798_06010 [Ancylothrix sp. C2]|uniref:GumC family protein n=1 Tax=Ancylothrix sp. D3o TaxID=2953691 RepID=UPI0021BB1BA4|nr:hypothetical protein [Ancylothrix sp. D3o]MCT7949335.1 hypothetical protein [Ancylothrix sp. D3o]
MTDSLLPSTPLSEPVPAARPKKSNLGRILIGLGLLINGALWAAAIAYIKLTPSNYTSEFTIFLPAASSSANVNVSDTNAQVEGSNQSPYQTLIRVDPRQNYLFIANSRTVLSAAAAAVQMPMEDFGTPLVGTNKNDTLMSFKIDGSSPAEAQRKAQALYKALVQQIDSLREEMGQKEFQRQQSENQLMLKDAQGKLEAANKQLAIFKKQSPLRRSEQIGELSGSLESLRQEREMALASLQQTSSRLQQLGASLNISVEQASDIITLQADEIFLKQWADYSAASANLSSLLAQWRPGSPQIESAEAKLTTARFALQTRATAVLGKQVGEETLQQLNRSLNSSGGTRESLFQDVVTLQADQKGYAAKLKSLDEQIAQLDSQVKVLIQEQFTLTDLERNAKVADNYFTSTMAQLNLSKPEVATSYPVVQLIADPSLPAESSGPDKKLPLLGALAFTLLSVTGVALFSWERSLHKNNRIIEDSNSVVGQLGDE